MKLEQEVFLLRIWKISPYFDSANIMTWQSNK
jgi:hypothetical protein